MLSRRIRLLLVMLSTGLVAAAPAMAQTAGQGAPLGATKDAIAARVTVDAMAQIVSPRGADALEAARLSAERMERQARDRRSRARQARDESRAAENAESQELERLMRAKEIAEELEQSARLSRLERDRALRERYRDLIRERTEAYELEMELAEREERHARALLELLDVERRLADDLRQWRLLHGEGAVWTDAEKRREETEKTILERLRRYFESERDEARQRELVAESRRTLAEKRLEFIERRRDLFED